MNPFSVTFLYSNLYSYIKEHCLKDKSIGGFVKSAYFRNKDCNDPKS